ncbi:MAG: 4Fe-4S binding protein, partial [Clostridia bacterium]|nr:4Fe-4S binding protein [Clostridia bacterium]
CRIGTKRLLQLLTKITEGKVEPEDIVKIEELASHMKQSSLCALGQSAPNPVLSTLRYFRKEYEDHINDKKCEAGVCKAMLSYSVDAEKCKGCTLCARNCPVKAISGTVKQPHVIDTDKCIKCGVCMTNCRFGAIVRK